MTEMDRRLAQAALQSGNNKEARRILRPLVHQSPDDWTLWWQLAQATDEVEQKITCLKQVAKLNPSHADAAKLLRQIERKIARPTPVTGVRRPIHETEQAGDMNRGEPAVREGYRYILAKFSFARIMVVVIAIGFLAMIIGGASIVYRRFKSSPQATDLPSRSLSIQVDGCIVDGGEAAIVTFKNLSSEELTVSRGELEAEDVLFKLDVGAESSIEVSPDEPIRYAARVNEGITNGGGATIAVPAGSTCTVVVR